MSKVSIKKNSLSLSQILIVDDEPLSTKLISDTLNKEGYQNIHQTNNPLEVIDLCKSIHPDLIILDLNMPEMNGFAVMDALNNFKSNAYIPILVLTSEKGQKEKIRALKAGAQDFINKPFDRLEILNRIHNILEIKSLHKQVQESNILLEQKVKERTKDLYSTQLDVINRLARAMEYRDNETGMHIIRMSHYSHLIAKKIGLSEDQCEIILTASPLHDIGKIGIPDNILLKPGKLTPEEWTIMKTHTTIGADLLTGSSSPFMQAAENITASHHEKWDGSGYPKGLKEEEIPLMARICGLCDAFDALTSVRLYKKAWSLEDTVAEIKKQKGRHFDPTLVDLFLDHFDEIIDLKNKYADQKI